MPSYYQCPESTKNSNKNPITTAYVAIVGDRTVWPRSGERTIREISDGPANSLAVLESEPHRLHWMSTADPAFELLGKADAITAGSHHRGQGGAYCRCDGSVGWLDPDTDDRELSALITIDDEANPD